MAVVSRDLTITQGNLGNRHMTLTECMDIFPADVFSLSDGSHVASRTVRVHFGKEWVDTDIVRDKNIFYRRGWVRDFFAKSGIVAGDRVLLEQLDLYSYRVSLASAQDAEPSGAPNPTA